MREKWSTHIFSGLCAEELTIRDLMLSLASLCTSGSAALSLSLPPKSSFFFGKVRFTVGICIQTALITQICLSEVLRRRLLPQIFLCPQHLSFSLCS